VGRIRERCHPRMVEHPPGTGQVRWGCRPPRPRTLGKPRAAAFVTAIGVFAHGFDGTDIEIYRNPRGTAPVLCSRGWNGTPIGLVSGGGRPAIGKKEAGLWNSLYGWRCGDVAAPAVARAQTEAVY